MHTKGDYITYKIQYINKKYTIINSYKFKASAHLLSEKLFKMRLFINTTLANCCIGLYVGNKCHIKDRPYKRFDDCIFF